MKATIADITDKEIKVRLHGQLISMPKELLPPNKKIGEEVIITLDDPTKINQESKAHLKAMQKALKEIIE